MAGKIIADTLEHSTAGSIATNYVVEGSAKAWGVDECAKVLVPDPNFCAAFLQGGILPPVWVYWELADDEAKPDFKRHTRGYLLHETQPIEAGTMEDCIEYLIMKDLPRHVWQTWDSGNKPKMVICHKDQLPSTREWRNAWRISDKLAA